MKLPKANAVSSGIQALADSPGYNQRPEREVQVYPPGGIMGNPVLEDVAK